MAERHINHFWEEARTPHYEMLLHGVSHWILLRATDEVAQEALILLHIGGDGPTENDDKN